MPCWTRWGSTTTNWPIIWPNAHRRPRRHHHHHHPRRREGAVDPGPEAEVEARDAAGCHPEGVAGTTTMMEARPVAGAAAAVEEGDVVAVAVAVGVAAAPPLDEHA